jgi:hypothetical protein
MLPDVRVRGREAASAILERRISPHKQYAGADESLDVAGMDPAIANDTIVNITLAAESYALGFVLCPNDFSIASPEYGVAPTRCRWADAS